MVTDTQVAAPQAVDAQTTPPAAQADSMPVDAPLYRIDAQRGAEYWGCRALMSVFTVDGDVSDLVPDGLTLDEPAIGAVLVAEYGASTLGPYGEFVSMLRVVDDRGTSGLYVPYIYVTNDAALTAGREVLGAPKKLARVTVAPAQEVVVGTLERPVGQPLATVHLAPTDRLGDEVLDAFLPAGTPCFSHRVVPGPPGATVVDELIRWHVDLAVRTDAFGDGLRFTGSGGLTYPTRSVVDPVARLAVGTPIATAYLEFDMRLRAGGVVWSRTVGPTSD